MAGNDITNMLYGRAGDLPTPMAPSDVAGMVYRTPLPSWIPPNVQNYIRTAPSYGEGQTPGPQWEPVYSAIQQEPPQQPAPQIADIQRLFNRGIMQNAPTSNQLSGPFLKSIIQTGHLGGGDEI